MKHKITFVTSAIFCILILALVSQNGDVLVMTLPLLIYLGVGIFFAPLEINLSAERHVDKRTDKDGTSIFVAITLTNHGGSLDHVLLQDQQFAQAEMQDGGTEQWVGIPAKGRTSVSYTFRARRGLFCWETIRVVASDPFGLVEIQKVVRAQGEILVQPGYERLSHIPLQPHNTIHSAGLVPARRGGSGLNFWAVREYQLGDSLRWLNWKTIARHPRRLYTTEFEHEEIMEIGLILDARLQTERCYEKKSLFESSVSAAMSLAELFLREGNRVGMLIFGQNMIPLQPGYGKKQLYRISAALANASVVSNFSLIYLEDVMKRLFSQQALIVMVSPFGLQDLQTYEHMRAFGHEVLLVSPDPVSFIAQHSPADEFRDLALRAARLERYAQLKKVLKRGVKVVDWDTQRSLGETLSSNFLSRAGRGLHV